jgi:hypothetical protein
MRILCGSYVSTLKRNITYSKGVIHLDIFLHNVSGPYIKSETTNLVTVQTLMTTQTESIMKNKTNARQCVKISE